MKKCYFNEGIFIFINCFEVLVFLNSDYKYTIIMITRSAYTLEKEKEAKYE